MKNIKSIAAALTVAFSIAGWTQSANAVVFTQNHIDRGWWNGVDTSNNGAGFNNTFTGQFSGPFQGSDRFRSYFVFHQSGVIGNVVSAILSLERESHTSSDPSETLNAYDVSTSINTLRTSASNASTFANLGTGMIYGSFMASAGTVGTQILVNLSAAAIADTNANLGGLFAIGLSSQTIGNVGANDGVRFSIGAENRTHQLLLTDPEPGMLAIFGLGLAGLGFAWRKKAA